MLVLTLLLQIFLFFSYSIFGIDKYIVNLVVIIFIFNFYYYNKKCSNNYNFSVIIFFLIMSSIIAFQVPLEFFYGNPEFANHFIYNSSIIVPMVIFSGILFNVFFLGCLFPFGVKNKIGGNQIIKNKITEVKRGPLFTLLIAMFILFVITLNFEYLNGGHGTIDPGELSMSFLGIFIRISIIYIALTIYNNSDKLIKISLFEYFKLYNKGYYIMLIIIMYVFFSANNRVYVIYCVSPLLFGYFIFARKKIKLILVLLVFLSLSVFATLFRVFGIDNLLSKGFKIDDNYIIAQSYFPFTAELSGSVFSQSLLFYEWTYNSLTVYGYSYLVGVIRTIPGVMGMLGLSELDYDSGMIATAISSLDYGVGTTIQADFLINFGFIGAIIAMFIFASVLSRYEYRVYNYCFNSLRTYVIYFTISSFILFIPRSSLADLIGALLFNILFINLYFLIYKK